MTQHALIMLAAGIGIPVLAALNARLGANIGSPAAAAFILFIVAFTATCVVTFTTGTSALARLSGGDVHNRNKRPGAAFRPTLVSLPGWDPGGFLCAVDHLCRPHFGVGNAVFFVLLGQLVSAALIDHFGLFGAAPAPLTLLRMSGILVMAAGVALTQLAARG